MKNAKDLILNYIELTAICYMPLEISSNISSSKQAVFITDLISNINTK